MSPEELRRSFRPPWIVVAGRCRPTANNNTNETHQTGNMTANGPHLRRAREENVPLANGILCDGLMEHGSEATDARPDRGASGRMRNNREKQNEERKNDANGEEQKSKRGRKTKAALLIGSLNMNGRGNIAAMNSKWSAVNQILRARKMGILALQETHLAEEEAATVKRLYGRRIHIIHLADPEKPTSARGVAIIINREMMDVNGVQSTTLIPGRAIMSTLHWHADHKLTILNVYAPNPATDNAEFWNELHHIFTTKRLRRPDIMAGDFNIVEEAMDRVPVKESQEAPREALKRLTDLLGIYDGWRIMNLNGRTYTYPQKGGPQRAHLD